MYTQDKDGYKGHFSAFPKATPDDAGTFRAWFKLFGPIKGKDLLDN